MDKRIAITGFGVKVPNGENNEDYLKNLLSGNYHFAQRSDLAPNGEPVLIGDLVGDLEELENKEYRILPRTSKLAIKTTMEALNMANFTEKDFQDIGVFFGTTMGGTHELENFFPDVYHNTYKHVPIYGCGLVSYHSIASSISSYFNIHGISKTITTACTSGLESLEDAIMYMRNGKIKKAIVGGTDSSNCKTLVFGFGRIKGIPFNQDEHSAGSPFNKNSRGFILSEGAATLIIEFEEDALKRGATIYGYVDEISSNNDAVSVNGTDKTGESMMKTVRDVLKNRTPDYYNSQALGYRSNDDVETIVSQEIFDNKVPITTIKGLTGHPLGASGLAQLIASLLGFQHNFIPKTIRTNKYGYESVPLVTDTIHTNNTNNVLITSHGYGGNNVSVFLVKK